MCCHHHTMCSMIHFHPFQRPCLFQSALVFFCRPPHHTPQPIVLSHLTFSVILTLLLRQNDVVTSFWLNNGVIIMSFGTKHLSNLTRCWLILITPLSFDNNCSSSLFHWPLPTLLLAFTWTRKSYWHRTTFNSMFNSLRPSDAFMCQWTDHHWFR